MAKYATLAKCGCILVICKEEPRLARMERKQQGQVLLVLNMKEGRVRNASGTLKYEYNITDQQGNVRVSFEEDQNGNARIIQENHYYAFGLAMKGSIIRTAIPVTANKNLYNGMSELQDDFGDDPNVYSTFFREYDPVLGRMNVVDPMADKYGSYSPYIYSANDPINLNDPSGGDWMDDYIHRIYNGYFDNTILPDDNIGSPYEYKNAEDLVIHYAIQNRRQDLLNALGITSALLPEVKISELKSGNYPSWWGHGELFVNDGDDNKGGGYWDGVDKRGAIDATIGILGGTAEVILGVG